ncbi:hypothetical protein CLOM_g1486 [Closterium sp. NIES-68]|nr:hypothetical protein CLOM_g1486 [Closterium sp. NIES-68]GJP59979.1 hypothetical protein CLOP_g17082 [Closterium sp. NIES-67]GJP61769.1 hypothetical protein CLOP_g18904 [Closterium sp. NIES-67]
MASRIPPPSSPLRHLPFPPTSPRRPTSKTAPPAPPRVEQRKSGGRAEHPLHGRARNLESAVGEAGEAGRMAGGVVTAAPNHRGWVRGSDAANLAMTRGAQRDMWRHQFPASCTGRRLMLTRWPGLHHGMGSMVHVMGAYLSIALRSNRTLVVMPGTFERATRECEDLHKAQQWECYFFPISSPGCVQEAMAAHDRGEAPDIWAQEGREDMLAGATQVVYLALSSLFGDIDAARLRWGKPWLDRPHTIQEAASISTQEPDWMMARWWRAQTTRFLLRWPSAHLCHVINRVRHVSYGLLVANRVAAVAAQQGSIVESLNATVAASSAATSAATSSAEERDPLDDLLLLIAAKARETGREILAANGNATRVRSLQSHVWPNRGRSGCHNLPSSIPAAFHNPSSSQQPHGGSMDVGGEVFMVRPVVSMHVRLSDKGSEMGLHPLPSFLVMASRLRQHRPDLRHVWLSTEVQSVIDETNDHPDWTFFYTNSSRVNSAEQMKDAHENARQPMGIIFANLLITSECDYFIGSLGSNWNRLIDELRSTNGRLYAGLISFTFGL